MGVAVVVFPVVEFPIGVEGVSSVVVVDVVVDDTADGVVRREGLVLGIVDGVVGRGGLVLGIVGGVVRRGGLVLGMVLIAGLTNIFLR